MNLLFCMGTSMGTSYYRHHVSHCASYIAPPPSRSTESQSLPDSRRGGHIESLQKSRAQSRLYSQRNRDKQRRQIEELQGLQLELETERSSLIMLNRNYHERLLAAKAENEALLQLLNRRQQILYRAAEASASADRYRHVRSILNRPPSLMYPPFNNPLAQQSFHPMFGLSQPSMPPMGAYLPGGGGTSRMLQSPLGTNLPPPPSWPGPPGSFNPFPGQLSTTPLDMELIMRQQLLMQHQPPANPEMEEVLRRGRLDHWPERPIGDSSGSVWTTVERRRDRSDDLPSILDQASLLLHQQPPPQESDDESSTWTSNWRVNTSGQQRGGRWKPTWWLQNPIESSISHSLPLSL